MFSHVKNIYRYAYRWLLLICLFITGCFDSGPETVNWRLQSQAVRSSFDFQELQSLANSIHQMSAGRFTLELYASGELTSGPDIYTAVQEGRIEMGNGWPNWWSGKHPAWALMNAGTFEFKNLDASMMFFLSGPGTDIANSMANSDGVLWRPAWWHGMEFGLFSKEPINSWEDLENKQVRIGPSLPSEVLSAVSGAVAIPLLPQEIRPALEHDEIDAVEWTTARGAVDLGLHEVSTYAIVPAVWQQSALSDWLINQQAYDALPKDLQLILESAIRAHSLTMTMHSKVKDFKAYQQIKEQGI